MLGYTSLFVTGVVGSGLGLLLARFIFGSSMKQSLGEGWTMAISIALGLTIAHSSISQISNIGGRALLTGASAGAAVLVAHSIISVLRWFKRQRAPSSDSP